MSDPNARVPGDPGTTDENGKHLTPQDVSSEDVVSKDEEKGNPEATYWDMTVPELRSELEKRELDTDGNKPDLVERLESDDASRAEQE